MNWLPWVIIVLPWKRRLKLCTDFYSLVVVLKILSWVFFCANGISLSDWCFKEYLIFTWNQVTLFLLFWPGRISVSRNSVEAVVYQCQSVFRSYEFFHMIQSREICNIWSIYFKQKHIIFRSCLTRPDLFLFMHGWLLIITQTTISLTCPKFQSYSGVSLQFTSQGKTIEISLME